MMKKLRSKGFTLMELLIIIAVIAVLATLSYLALQTVRAKARDAKRVANVKQITTALEMYFSDKGYYPTEDEFTSGSLFSTSTFAGAAVYMQMLPQAPTPADGGCTEEDNLYHYQRSLDGSNYRLDFCIGGRVGAINSGINAGTPAGFVQLAQGYFVDEAMAGIKVLTEASPEDMNSAGNYNGILRSKINLTTDNNGGFKYPVRSENLFFFVGDIKLGEIKTAEINNDKVIFFPEIVKEVQDLYGSDSKKRRDEGYTNDKALRLARFLQAVSEENPSNPERGRIINQDILSDVEISAVSSNFNVDIFVAYKNEEDFQKKLNESLAKYGVSILDVSAMQTLAANTLSDVDDGVYTKPGDTENTPDVCDDTTTLCNFKACGDSGTYNSKNYDTILVGGKCWLKQNLNVGSMLQDYGTVASNDKLIEKWCPGPSSKGGSSIDQSSALCDTYGAMYDWIEAMNLPKECRTVLLDKCTSDKAGNTCTDGKGTVNCSFTYPRQGLCPSGWHVATLTEWNEAAKNLDSNCDLIGRAYCDKMSIMKEDGKTHWLNGYCSGLICNSTGFTALPNGYINIVDKKHLDLTYNATWLTASLTKNGEAIAVVSMNDDENVQLLYKDEQKLLKSGGVRCIKD